MDNSQRFREVNLRIYQLGRAFEGRSEYVCECGDVGCSTMIPLALEAFEEILGMPGCYFVEPGHDGPDSELVHQRNGYLIVRREPARHATLS